MRGEIRLFVLAVALAACHKEPAKLDASAECFQRGQAAVHVAASVECRPIKYVVGLGRLHSLRLVAGKGPAPLALTAVGTDGKPMTVISVSAVVRDTSIIVVRDGLIYPRKPGRTVIDLILGCQTFAEVTVYASADSTEHMKRRQLYSDSVSISPGEHRFWKLPVGTYAVEVDAPDSTTRPALSTFAAKCREWNYIVGHFRCTAEPGAAIVLRNQNKGRNRNSVAAGRITILRTDGPPLPSLGPEQIPQGRMCAI